MSLLFSRRVSGFCLGYLAEQSIEHPILVVLR